MAVDMFLKIDGIKGESQDHKHKDEIDIIAWNWGAQQTGTAHVGGGMGAGKVNVSDLSFSKHMDVASPELFLRCCTGAHIPTAVLTVRKAGGEQQEYLRITLKDALVSAIQDATAGADERPQETFTLNFRTLNIEYKQQKPDGTLDAPVTVGYDLGMNKKI